MLSDVHCCRVVFQIAVTKKEVPVEPLDVLEIESVDLHQTANQTTHFTADYEYDGLVVRRGQRFTVSITTNKTVPKGMYIHTCVKSATCVGCVVMLMIRRCGYCVNCGGELVLVIGRCGYQYEYHVTPYSIHMPFYEHAGVK